jgi:hypothetical protein
MYCPNCGRDDSHKNKFCPSCGTNLKAIMEALTDDAAGTFGRIDKSLDEFVGRYAEHVFKDAPAKALDRRIRNSWELLIKGALTSLFDLALFTIMTALLPIRFLILLVYTPVRLLAERNRDRSGAAAELEGRNSLHLPNPQPRAWLPNPVASITEHTTVSLSKKK